MYYKTKDGLTTSIKNDTLCKSCAKKGERNSFYGKRHTEESKNKQGIKEYTEEGYLRLVEHAKSRIGKKNPFYGKQHSKETIELLKRYEKTEEHQRKLSESLRKYYETHDGTLKGYKHSMKTIVNMRKAALKRLEKKLGITNRTKT